MPNRTTNSYLPQKEGKQVRLNNYGLSLIEILIVLGVLAVVSTGMMSLALYMMETSRKISLRLGTNAIVSELQLLTSGQSSCAKAITQDESGAINFQKITGAAKSEKGQDIRFILSSGENAVDAELNENLVDIDRLYLSNTHFLGLDSKGNKTFRSQLILEVKDKRKTNGSVAIKPRVIGSVMLIADAGNRITDCFSYSDSSLQYMCESLGGIYDAATTECNNVGVTLDSICVSLGGTFNFKTQKCKLSNAGGCPGIWKPVMGGYSCSKDI